MTKKTKDVLAEDLSFEEAFASLSEILEKLEVGDLSLTEGLRLYEQGMTLAKHCGLQLANAELQLETIGKP